MADSAQPHNPDLDITGFGAILDRTGALVYAIDAELNVVALNAALRHRTDVDVSAVPTLADLLRGWYPDPTARDTILAVHRGAFTQAPTRPYEWTLLTAAGERRPVRWQFHLARPDLLVAVGEDVSERRTHEHWLRLLGTVLDRAPEAIVVADLEGAILHWTGTAEAVFGHPATSALERPLSNLLPGEGGRGIVQEWIAAVRKSSPVTRTAELRRASGESIERTLLLSRVDDERGEMVALALFATAPQANAGAETPDPPATEKALAGISAVGVAQTSGDGTIQLWSTGAERLASLTAGRAIGKRLLDEVLRCPELGWDALVSRLSARGRHAARVTVERQNGTRLLIDLDAVATKHPDGTLASVTTVLVDRSDELLLGEEALATKARAPLATFGESLTMHLASTASVLEPDLLALHRRLHDLDGLVTLVASGASAQDLDAHVRASGLGVLHPGGPLLDRIGEVVHRLRTLVEDVGRFTATEADPPGPVRIGREIASARALLEPALAGRLVTTFTLEDAPAVRAARGPLLRGLCYLLLAALESAGGTAEPRVYVEARAHNGWVHVEVRDNGTGYAVDIQSRLGDTPWLAARNGLSPLYLGLAAREIRQAGGAMEVTTAAGTGARVRLSFPAADAIVAVRPLGAVRTHAGAHGHVLVVEEDELLRRTLERFVGEAHRVTGHGSLADVLPSLGPENYDAAVITLTRPESLGLRLLERLVEAAPRLARATIMLVPGSASADTRATLIDRGHLVLSRPVDWAALRSMLLHLLPPEELVLDDGG